MSKYKEIFIATTDTVLGMGAPISKHNKKAIYDLKKRPLNKPLITMVGSLEQARELACWTKEAEKMAIKVWPGATTLVLSSQVSVRLPDNVKLCNLIKKIGPIYMTSANISGDKPYTLEQAREIFRGKITKFYDFGLGSNKPSTVIDVKTGKVYR